MSSMPYPSFSRVAAFIARITAEGSAGSTGKEKGEPVTKEPAEKAGADTTSKASTESKTEDKKIATQQVESATTKSK